MRVLWFKVKQFLHAYLKIVISLLCIGWIIFQWHRHPMNFEVLLLGALDIPFLHIALAIACSLASWVVESLKWQVLVSRVVVLRFRESVTQSLIGQAASYLTPLRLGEWMAKSHFYPKENVKKITAIAAGGNLIQLLVTLMMGSLGILYSYQYLTDLAIIGIVISTGVIAISLSFIKSHHRSLRYFNAFVLSILRYTLFAGSWVWIGSGLYPQIHMSEYLVSISWMYILVSITPILQIADMPLRYTTASMVLERHSWLPEHILLITTIVWITNSLLPTLLGAIIGLTDPIKKKISWS